jgi:hypothetical protein
MGGVVFTGRDASIRDVEGLMTVEGYVDYQRREYCKDIRCPVQIELESAGPDSSEYERIREVCKKHCRHTTYEFHHWLIGKGYVIVRPKG